MLIGGLQKLTLIDYPGKVAATIFTVGCVFRCPFCHNPELVLTEPTVKNAILHEDEVLKFLISRKNLLEAVCITGGEPTMQADLPEFIKKIKSSGFFVKLDTNGINPEMLKNLITDKVLDYIAMDIKAPWKKYHEIVGNKIDVEKIKTSVKIIIDSGLPHEFRSTILPRLHSRDDIYEMARQISGADSYFLQQFKSATKLVDPKFSKEKKYREVDLLSLIEELKLGFRQCGLRN